MAWTLSPLSATRHPTHTMAKPGNAEHAYHIVTDSHPRSFVPVFCKVAVEPTFFRASHIAATDVWEVIVTVRMDEKCLASAVDGRFGPPLIISPTEKPSAAPVSVRTLMDIPVPAADLVAPKPRQRAASGQKKKKPHRLPSKAAKALARLKGKTTTKKNGGAKEDEGTWASVANKQDKTPAKPTKATKRSGAPLADEPTEESSAVDVMHDAEEDKDNADIPPPMKRSRTRAASTDADADADADANADANADTSSGTTSYGGGDEDESAKQVVIASQPTAEETTGVSSAPGNEPAECHATQTQPDAPTEDHEADKTEF